MRRLLLWPLLTLTTVLLFVTSARAAELLPFDGGFEKDTRGWEPYEDKAPNSAFERSNEAAHSGNWSLKFTTPGIHFPEGVAAYVPVIPGRSHRISLWIKGTGTMLPAVIMPNRGWVYGPHIQVSNEWKEYSMEFVATKGDQFNEAMGAHFNIMMFSKPAVKGPFFIDDLRIEAMDAPEVPDVEVPPFRIEAEDYRSPFENGEIVADASTGGGNYVSAPPLFWLTRHVPLVPQTGRPFYLYLRARASGKDKTGTAVGRNFAGEEQEIEKLVKFTVPESTAWRWIRTGPYTSDIGKKFGVFTSEVPGKTDLDSVVIATDDKLTDVDLDGIKE